MAFTEYLPSPSKKDAIQSLKNAVIPLNQPDLQFYGLP